MSTAPTHRGSWAALRGIARAGCGSVLLHPLRSAATVACVTAIVLPYVVGAGIADGLRHEMTDAVSAGPDLHVTGTRYGRAAPLPTSALDIVRAIPGVQDVTPRIVGELYIGARDESAVVVGVPAEALPDTVTCIEGRLFAPGAANELVLGSELATRLGLGVGDAVPPFYRNADGERVSRVVGVFRSDAPLWQSHVIFTSLETARALHAERDTVTSLLVRCPPSYRDAVAEQLRSLPSLAPPGERPVLRARVTTRDDLEARLRRRLLDRETLFQLPFVLAFAIGIPLVLVTSGVGLRERRREAGLLRAVGWSVDGLLIRSLVEGLVLTLSGSSLAILLAALWLGLLNGAGIAAILLPGAAGTPEFRVPWQLQPVPAILACAVTGVLVFAGSTYATWRAATTPPSEAMR